MVAELSFRTWTEAGVTEQYDETAAQEILG